MNQVCKLFQQVTRSKIVWLSLAATIENQVDIAKADESLSTYTAKELEDWVIRHSWVTSLEYGAGPDFPHRTTQVKLGQYKILVPGGRWLLWAHRVDKEFILSYIDLDSEALETTVLLTVGKSEGIYDPVDCCDIWIVPEAPKLTFRVVLWNPSFVEPSSRRPSGSLIPIVVPLMVLQSM